MSDEIFTSDWVTQFVPSWTKHIVPCLAGKPGVRWLEVGSYEGRSALWSLDNFLQGDFSTITCVDVWEKVWEQTSEREQRFDANVAGRLNLVKIRGRSDQVLPKLPPSFYHGVYVDGSHEEEDVCRDARMVLPLLQPGAFIVFDDYEACEPRPWAAVREPVAPRQFGVHAAVDRFLLEMGEKIEVLHRDWQLIARLRGELFSL